MHTSHHRISLFAALATAAVLSGCTAFSDEDSSGVYFIGTASDGDDEDVTRHDSGEEGAPAALLEVGQDDSAPSEAVETAAQNCVYIQYCDDPDPNWRTIGRTRNTGTCIAQCNRGDQAIFDEFHADAKVVCGGTRSPWLLACF